MNDDSQSHPPINELSDENPEAENVSEDTSRPFEDFGKSVQDAFRTGSEDARKAFEEAIPKAKEDLAQGVHDVAYAVAYASAFGSSLLKELTLAARLQRRSSVIAKIEPKAGRPRVSPPIPVMPHRAIPIPQ